MTARLGVRNSAWAQSNEILTPSKGSAEIQMTQNETKIVEITSQLSLPLIHAFCVLDVTLLFTETKLETHRTLQCGKLSHEKLNFSHLHMNENKLMQPHNFK